MGLRFQVSRGAQPLDIFANGTRLASTDAPVGKTEMAEPAPSNLAPRVIRFGVFEVDLRAAELRKSGARIKLEGQPFHILALLLERPGEVITREELQQKLWPADTFVDFEHSINTAVKRLREVLGDSADAPRFIETLPRHGYRFIYPIDGARAEVVPPAAWWRAPWVVSPLVVAALLALALAMNFGGLRDRVFGPAVGPIDSVAVLPCKNLTGDPEQEFRADSLTDVLTTHLARVKTLTVPSVTSSMYFKGERKKLPEIARELKVKAVVEPSVQWSGQKLLLNFQLIHGPTDRHLWANEYSSDPKDVQSLLPRVARDLVEAMKVSLTPEEKSRLASSRQTTPEAFEAFSRGRYHLRKGTEEDREKAARLFAQVIELDANYAPAYGELAVLYAHGGAYLLGPEVEAGVQARQCATKGLELDDTLPQAHAALGWLAINDWDWGGAEQHFKRAIELNPNYAIAHTWYAQFLAYMRRIDEAFAQANIAVQLEPADPTVVTHAVIPYWEAGRIDEAMAYWKKVLDLEPNYWAAHNFLGRVYVKKGMYKEAIAAFEKSVALRGRDNANLGTLAHAYAKAGRRQEALKLVGELEERARRSGRPGAYGLAIAYAGLGEKDRAFAVLEKAYEQRRAGMFFLNSEPLFEPFQSDPRFRNLMLRIGLPPQSLPPPTANTSGKSGRTHTKTETKNQ